MEFQQELTHHPSLLVVMMRRSGLRMESEKEGPVWTKIFAAFITPNEKVLEARTAPELIAVGDLLIVSSVPGGHVCTHHWNSDRFVKE